MAATLGIHWAHTTYGAWLHGDWRGSWKTGKLIGRDPFLEANTRQHMRDDAVVLNDVERILVATAFGKQVRARRYRVYAATVQSNHVHMILAPMRDDIGDVINWLKRQSAAEVFKLRRQIKQPVPRHMWTGGRFPVFIFTETHLHNAIQYVRSHNVRAGLPADPYDWVDPLSPYTPHERTPPDRRGRAM